MMDEKRLLEEFITLASFDSESFQEKDIAAYVFRKLKALGLYVEMDDAGHRLSENEKAAGNIYAFLKGNQEGEPILFSSHLDTVAPGKGKKVIVHEDGRVTSDGTTVLGADDLTGVAAILEMLTVIVEKNLRHPDIEVVFFIAEEPYCRGSFVFDFSKIKSKRAYVLDLDGRVGTIANRAPSILQYKVEINGKSAHAGFEPEKGISAIAVAANAISRLSLGRIDENTTANVGLIQGGTGKNIIPETVILEGEVRSLVHEKALQVIGQIEQEFSKAAYEAGAHISFFTEEMIRAYHVHPDTDVIKSYHRALRELGYKEGIITTTFGGSDNNTFNQHGIEGIVLANAMNSVHTRQEFFYMDEFVKSAKIILKLATLCD